MFSEALLLCLASSTSDCKQQRLLCLHDRDQQGTGALPSPRTSGGGFLGDESTWSKYQCLAGASTPGAQARLRRGSFGCHGWLGDLSANVPCCAMAESWRDVAWSWDPPGSNVWGHAAVSGVSATQGAMEAGGWDGSSTGFILPQGLAQGPGAVMRHAGCARPEGNPTPNPGTQHPAQAAQCQESLHPAMAALKSPH